MKTRVSVRSRASRILRRLTAYRDLTAQSPDHPPWIHEVPVQPGEQRLGVYENVPGSAEKSVVVTTLGLYVRRGERWEFVRFEDIEAVVAPHQKTEVAELALMHRDRHVTLMPITGGHGRFREAWEFLRFMDRVLEDFGREGGVTQTSPPST